MLDAVLNVSLALSPGIFTTTLGGRYIFLPLPFMDEETRSEKLRSFSKVTQLVSGRAGSGTVSADQSPSHPALSSFIKRSTS